LGGEKEFHKATFFAVGLDFPGCKPIVFAVFGEGNWFVLPATEVGVGDIVPELTGSVLLDMDKLMCQGGKSQFTTQSISDKDFEILRTFGLVNPGAFGFKTTGRTKGDSDIQGLN
jgi:hypothetical protein